MRPSCTAFRPKAGRRNGAIDAAEQELRNLHDVAAEAGEEPNERKESEIVGRIAKLKGRLVTDKRGRVHDVQTQARAAKAHRMLIDAKAERSAFIKRHAEDIQAAKIEQADAIAAEYRAILDHLAVNNRAWRSQVSEWRAIAEDVGDYRPQFRNVPPGEPPEQDLKIALLKGTDRPLPLRVLQKLAKPPDEPVTVDGRGRTPVSA